MSDQVKAVPAKDWNQASCCGQAVARLELEMEVRAGGVAGRADEADRLAGRELGAGDDVRVEHREMAVRPHLAVEGPERQADAAARVGRAPGAHDDRVRERVERRAHRRRDVDGGIVVVGVRGGDEAGAAADREDVARAVRRRAERAARRPA